ncbi:LytR/AlgR family response regulator transcription factor [Hymenobacter volaticus]|uniref:LytTR family DNA-binding domain-containing protein n=1 Tax=Hymenobacter volaticus TaxID=2932254 RepID=A0ABY4GEH5_9BACT|nr:LytTR family DNA-binding domain-containing protein [Hymenobacter volaticus]UOQ69248.1 LytTR family DNA-binding domain-containing protein [Hymenobacter volaticus]
MLKAVLVDDEKNALEILEWQLQTYCPHVHIAELCTTADEGIAAIHRHAPHLVFLDIEMPHKNGFELLRSFPDPPFAVLFTTAYDQFAVKAFKFAALDYLLKPIAAEELVTAVQRYEKQQPSPFKDQLELLLQHYSHPALAPSKLPFATQDGITFVKPKNIARCESSSNYTTLFFTDKSKLIVSKTLKEVEELLQPHGFLRVHHSHLLNVQQVSRYVKAEGGLLK